ncbi:MAG: alanine racemase [Chloroflexota bacterium]|nr:MAG: alanine racemase [Chloroflexota bacterium]
MAYVSSIQRPTLVLNETRARRNIRHMADKAAASGVRFRPHFKTHQSAGVGEWFRDASVGAITVSSVDMAAYFARHGWLDITVAFPVNVRQAAVVNELAGQIQLNLLVESAEAVETLAPKQRHEAAAWIKIDTGYGRTGIQWDDNGRLSEVARAVEQTQTLGLTGLLAHAGHTYGARSVNRIVEIYRETASRMVRARDALAAEGWHVLLSVGDTPSCSIMPRFESVNEVRPGNFVFYDLAQLALGACSEADIALAVACPVVAKHGSRSQLVIYGGAVHLSKESIPGDDGHEIYGRIALPAEQGWSSMYRDRAVVSLSQEHGIVQAEEELFSRTRVGDLLVILPVHSCLTANLLGKFVTVEGRAIEMAKY